MGFYSVCDNDQCITLKTFCDDLSQKLPSSKGLISTECQKTKSSSLFVISSLVMSFIGLGFLINSIKVMQPLSISDPSLSRLKASYLFLLLSALLLTISLLLVLPATSQYSILNSLSEINSFQLGYSAKMYIVSIVILMGCVVLIIITGIGSLREARRVYFIFIKGFVMCKSICC